MTKREMYLKAIRREIDGIVPFELFFTPSKLIEFNNLLGTDSYADFLEMPFNFVGIPTIFDANIFKKYFDKKLWDNPKFSVSEFGVGNLIGNYEHFTHIENPLIEANIEDIEKYPFPNADTTWDWNACKKKIEYYKSKDRLAVAGMPMTIFETCWYIRGMENFLMDMLTEEDTAILLMDKITDIRIEQAKKYATLNVDILHIGDDVATQRGMMMSVELWKKLLMPRLKKIIDATKQTKKDLLIDYHSDGNIEDIVPYLIDIGVDILNPIQPECMNVLKMKQLYGNKIAFRGALGTQTVMPFGSKEDVKKQCEWLLENIGKGGGFILSPSHQIEPEVPLENVLAMLETITKFNNKTMARLNL